MTEKPDAKKNDAPIGCGAMLIIVAIIFLAIWGYASCGSRGDSKHAASTSAVASSAPDDTNAPVSAPVDTASDDFLAAARAAGAVGTDDTLRTDGLAACAALRGDVDHPAESAVGISGDLTQPPYSQTQHAADEIVIDAVKFICPDLQSKIDNPLEGN